MATTAVAAAWGLVTMEVQGPAGAAVGGHGLGWQEYRLQWQALIS